MWAVQDGRWIEVGPSQFDHEEQGLAMRRRIHRRLDDYLRFTTNPAVPAGDNAAERNCQVK